MTSIIKRLLCPERLRRVPESFSWVDHRLVRDRYISRCSHEALALYLLLVTVADAEGLSYYSDPSVGRLLHMEMGALVSARRELEAAGLVAYSNPLYQVLCLDHSGLSYPVRPRQSGGSIGDEANSMADALDHAIGGAA